MISAKKSRPAGDGLAAGTNAKAPRGGFGRPGKIRPIRLRRLWLGGPLVKDVVRDLEAALRPAELDQILKAGLRRLPWRPNQGCSLMLLMMVLLGGATTLAGLDAGRRVLERLAERHRQSASVTAIESAQPHEVKVTEP